MRKVFLILLILTSLLIGPSVYARTTPEDIQNQTRFNFENNLSKIEDPKKKQLILSADQQLKNINQTVCNRLELDINKLSAIFEELKSRENVTNTIVAYGQGSTPLDTAAYYLNYAAEALAYQRAQDYTPAIGGGNLKSAINYSSNNLKSNLGTLQNKILRAKSEVKKAINAYEK
ncbi:MAG: hypothetical protein PHQ59_02010 [Candidatus Daviesbacteria bacterium]|nr:hypothetical protein [Candidatus Daviesbacteria bacterium]